MLTGRAFFEPPEAAAFGFGAALAGTALGFSGAVSDVASVRAALPFGRGGLFGPVSGRSIASVCGGSFFWTITFGFFPSSSSNRSFSWLFTFLLLLLVISDLRADQRLVYLPVFSFTVAPSFALAKKFECSIISPSGKKINSPNQLFLHPQTVCPLSACSDVFALPQQRPGRQRNQQHGRYLPSVNPRGLTSPGLIQKESGLLPPASPLVSWAITAAPVLTAPEFGKRSQQE